MPGRGSSESTVTARARCAAPTAEFVAFAQKLVQARSRKQLQALAESPAAEDFAKRLIVEALTGLPHAVPCLKVIGRLGEDTSWGTRLQQKDATGELPSPEAVKSTDTEPVARGLLVISPRLALPFIAGAYLLGKGGTDSGVVKLLLATARTPGALVEALDDAVGALQSRRVTLTARNFGRCLWALERVTACGAADRAPQPAQELPLVKLAREAGRTEAAQLLAALLPAARTPATQAPPVNAITEAAWSEADEALGRALRDMDFMGRAFDRLEAAAQDGLAEPVRKARNATQLVLQWVHQTARYREVATVYKTGDRVPYDPTFHDLDGDVKAGGLIRILKPAIVRGTAPYQVVLLRALAEPD